MKIRSGFVTNSSSSSFIIEAIDGVNKKVIEDYIKHLLAKRPYINFGKKRNYHINEIIDYLGIPKSIDEAKEHTWIENKGERRAFKSIIKNKSHYLLVTGENELNFDEIAAIDKHFNTHHKHLG